MMHTNPFHVDLQQSGIPYFGKNGTALSQEERATIARRRGVCLSCGTQTHTFKPIRGRTPITNDDVYKGICIKCNHKEVPASVLKEWQLKNPKVAAAKPANGVTTAGSVVQVIHGTSAQQHVISNPPSPLSDESPGGGPGDRLVVGISKELLSAMQEAFSNLCTSPSGVLFENRILQVGVKHEYAGAQGKISIFFGNLHKSPLRHFRASIDESDPLKIQKQGTPGLLDDSEEGGCTVAIRTQVKLLVLVEVTAPFDDAPTMRVMFETEEGEVHEYPLRLPIVATCFMEPVTLEPKEFMSRWNPLEGHDRECQEVVIAPPQAPAIDNEYMKCIAHMIKDGLRFGRCQGCDLTPWKVFGAATFQTAAKDNHGNNINIGCFICIEANPHVGAFRVTTRTSHPLCSVAIMNLALMNLARSSIKLD